MTMGCHPPCTRFNRELNRKRLSQPAPDRVSFAAAWAGSTGRRIHWEDLMTREVQRDPQSVISRRTLVHGLAIAAGATVVGTSGALAQGAQGAQETAPPTTITTPPRDFGPGGAPTTYFWDPDIIAVDPSFNDIAQPNTAIKRL